MVEVFSTIKEAAERLERSVVTVGNFDGMHVGHREIFSKVQTLAGELGATSVALTFEPHPIAYFRPEAAPKRLSPSPYKFDLMADCGIDAVVALTFDASVADKSPEQFVEQMLASGLEARHVVVGEDFRFGKKRAGDTETLCTLGQRLGMGCTVAEFVEWNGEPVSSTRIRQAVDTGQLKAAQAMLGRPYRLWGQVVHGEKRGRKLGYPTANMTVEKMALPPDGIYITTLARAGRQHWRSVTSIGHRPTFDDEAHAVETYVFEDVDDDLDLYGDDVEVDFYRRVRGEEKFDNVEALIEAMDGDVEAAKTFFDEEFGDGSG